MRTSPTISVIGGHASAYCERRVLRLRGEHELAALPRGERKLREIAGERQLRVARRTLHESMAQPVLDALSCAKRQVPVRAAEIDARQLRLDVDVAGTAGARAPAAGGRSRGIAVGKRDVLELQVRFAAVVLPGDVAAQRVERDGLREELRQRERCRPRVDVQASVAIVRVERSREVARTGHAVVRRNGQCRGIRSSPHSRTWHRCHPSTARRRCAACREDRSVRCRGERPRGSAGAAQSRPAAAVRARRTRSSHRHPRHLPAPSARPRRPASFRPAA